MKKGNLTSLLQRNVPELIILLTLTVFFFLQLLNSRFWMNDFRVYYEAAGQLMNGEEVYGKAFGLDSGFYKYAPVALLFFVPFTWFSFHTAAVIYYFIICFIILLLFRNIKNLLGRHYFIFSGRLNLVVSLLGFIILGVHLFRELHLGNVNALLLLLALYAISLMLKGNKISAGIILAVCILFKLHFIILLPLLLLRKEGETLISFGVTFLTGLVILSLFVGIDRNCQLLTEWYATITAHNTDFGNFPNTTYAWLYQVLGKTAIRIPERILFLIVTAVVGILFFIFWKKHVKAEKKQITPRDKNYLIEYFLLIACIPNLMKTDTEHFLFSMPLILFLLILLFTRKLPKWGIILIVTGFFLYGGNWYELVGNTVSSFLDRWGLLGIGNWILIISAVIFYQKCFRTEENIPEHKS